MRILSLLIILLAVSACNKGEKTTNLDDIKDNKFTAQQLFDQGKEYLEQKKYRKATKSLLEIERLYTFSPLAPKAQVLLAYTAYLDQEYDDAIEVISNFLRLNPGNKDAPYMHYLRGLSYYERIADVKRDQKITEQALTALNELVQRFPQSQYSKDAKIKIDLLRDHLAGKEMEIARFYLKSKKYIAAVNRFQKVIENYPKTTHIEEALYRMTESYLLLGIEEEARRNAAVLGENYPESKWYKYAYSLLKGNKNVPSASDFMNIFKGDENKLPSDNIADKWLEKFKNAF